jgi:hypothetical protein
MVKGSRKSLPPKLKKAPAASVKDVKKAAKKPASKKAKKSQDEESKGDLEMTHTEIEDASQEISMINTMSKGRIPATQPVPSKKRAESVPKVGSKRTRKASKKDLDEEEEDEDMENHSG